MNQVSEIREQKNITYLEPSMRFNPGTLSYEPNLKKFNKTKLKRREKIKVWVLSAILILLMILIASWVFVRIF